MSAQTIDPRALKLAEKINRIAAESEDLLSGDRLARIIQSHFAEPANGKLLEAAKALIGGKWNHLCSDGIGGCNAISEALLSNLEEAISLAQSQPPSMADELAAALEASLAEHKEVLGFLTNRISQGESVSHWKEQTEAIIKKIEDVQKGQS